MKIYFLTGSISGGLVSAVIALAVISVFVACGEVKTTKVYPLETDTYISSEDQSSHATLPVLKISKNASVEERGVVRLPTRNEDLDQALAVSLAEDLLYFFFLPLEIIARILPCNLELVSAANLESAYLKFDISQDNEGALGNKLELGLLGKPWWQSTNWTQAHPFSATKGVWGTPGGDLDPSFIPVLSSVTGTVVSFDITSYFKNLMSSNGTLAHFGFLIRSVGSNLNSVSLHSVQGTGTRPRVEATFKATCTTQGYGIYKTVFSLGSEESGRLERLDTGVTSPLSEGWN